MPCTYIVPADVWMGISFASCCCNFRLAARTSGVSPKLFAYSSNWAVVAMGAYCNAARFDPYMPATGDPD